VRGLRKLPVTFFTPTVDSQELPVLKLGLAGFSPDQERLIQDAAAASRITQWVCGEMPGADAWVLNGTRTQHLGAGRVRVASGLAGGRSLQLQLNDLPRPVAFSAPLPPTLQAACIFELTQPQSIIEAIGVFEFALAATAAQFLLAAQVVQRQESLGAACFEVRFRSQLLAVVDMSGDAAVLPSVRPANFEFAVWKRIERSRAAVPDNFSRVSLSELMWRYISRTSLELLPPRYLNGPIFFRRAPRVGPLLVEEEHLLVMRELAIHALTFDELQRALEIPDAVLAKTLSALYYVGSITSTRARAASTTVAGDVRRASQGGNSNYGELRAGEVELSDLRQLTAPAPITFA
jgi:hypothetical protein